MKTLFFCILTLFPFVNLSAAEDSGSTESEIQVHRENYRSCHYCKSSRCNAHPNLELKPCENCRMSFCTRCIEKYQFEVDEVGCPVCKNTCCCATGEACKNRRHRHCASYGQAMAKRKRKRDREAYATRKRLKVECTEVLVPPKTEAQEEALLVETEESCIVYPCIDETNIGSENTVFAVICTDDVPAETQESLLVQVCCTDQVEGHRIPPPMRRRALILPTQERTTLFIEMIRDGGPARYLEAYLLEELLKK